MATASTMLAKSPNCCGGESLRESANSGSGLPLKEIIAKVCQRLWPTKADYELAYRIGTSDRSCRDVIAGRSTLSGESLARLLRSEEGIHFLAEIMGNARPAWWVGFLAHTKLQNARKKALLAEQEIRDAINAVDETTAAIARCEAALLVSDADFHRPSIDGLRAAARVPDRALAKGRR